MSTQQLPSGFAPVDVLSTDRPWYRAIAFEAGTGKRCIGPTETRYQRADQTLESLVCSLEFTDGQIETFVPGFGWCVSTESDE